MRLPPDKNTARRPGHDTQPQPIERPLPQGHHASATRRLVQFPLLGRGQDDLRRRRQGRPRARHRRQRIHRLPDGLRTLHPRLRRPARRRGRPQRASRSAVYSPSRPNASTRWPNASPGWCRPPSWCASRTPAPRPSWRHCASRAPTPARTPTSWSRAATTACSTRRSGTRAIEDWKPASGDPHLVPYSAGVPAILRGLLHAVPMNDADRLESVFKAYGARDRRVPDRADHGQLLLDLGDPGIPARRARALRPLRDPDDHRRGKDGFPRRARRRAGADGRQGGSLHLRQGNGQRLPDQRGRRARGHHAQARRRRRARRHLHLPFGRARRRREDARDPRRDAGAAVDRGVRHEAAQRDQPDPRAARHPPFVQRPSRR